MATVSASAAVGEVLRQPDDLVKLATFRNRLLKEKATLDAKLTEGVRSQLDATREALLKLQESRSAANMIREEMIEVEKLKGSDKDEGEAFNKITRVSTVHRNFSQTAKMVSQLQSMADKVDVLQHLLDEDRSQQGGPVGPCENLLPIHFQLQQLETFRNTTLHEAKNGDAGDKEILKVWFGPLDRLAREFEQWLWEIGANIIDLARKGYGGTVVRLLKIIEFERKQDEKAVALRLMRKVAGADTTAKFGTTANARVIKNYRHKLLEVMENGIKDKFTTQFEKNRHDLLAFIDSLQFIYQDIIRIKDNVEPLFAQDYEIVQWMIKRYHIHLNKVLHKVVESAPEAKVLLELHAWTKEYRQSMVKELEVPAAWLQPPLLDGKAQDLIEDYVRLIVTKLDEWTINLQREEINKFRNRTNQPNVLGDGTFGLDGVIDFFQLVNQQIDLALDSNQGAVLARVVSECAKVMGRVQREWMQVLAEESRKRADRKAEDVVEGLVEYVMALANDNMRAAANTETLQLRLEPLVSAKYKGVIVERLNDAFTGYVDVNRQCTRALVDYVFNDLRPATSKFMTPAWYQDGLFKQIVETMRDYMTDFQEHLDPAIFDMVVDDMIDASLITYLTALRRAQPKSLRMPNAPRRVRGDVAQIFEFFAAYKPTGDLEPTFAVMEQVASIIESSPDMIIMDYYDFAKTHGPHLDFVENILKSRDDLDRNAINDIMVLLQNKVAEEEIGEPPEPTIMIKVRGDRTGLIANLSTGLGSLADRVNISRS